jgi:putative ABC transport system permease protein
MLKNYLTTAYRFLIKNQLFTAINTLGLAVSIACTMVIYLYVKNELTFDEFHSDIDRLYILGEGSKEGGEAHEASYYQTVYPALPAMLAELPEIETGTRYFDWNSHLLIAGDKTFLQQVLYVDSTFLQTLSFPLITGDRKTALSKKDQIIISEEIAVKLFNSTDVLGKVITLENDKLYTIGGVLGKVPSNTSIMPRVLLPLSAKEDEPGFIEMGNWYNTVAQVVIKLRPNADVNEIRSKLPAFVKNHYDPAAKERSLKIYPLSHLRQSEARNETFIYGLSSIALFILLIAVINFMNLSIAASLKRLRETGIRKIMGSSKHSILLQFFLEAFLLSLVAIILSLGILQFMLPFLNKLLGMELELSVENLIQIGALSLALAAIIASVAGGYPAMYLSAYNTVNAVKGVIPNYHGKVTLRNSLVVIQFVVSIFMIISVMVASRQVHHMKSADLKFNKENILVADLTSGFKDPKTAGARLRSMITQLEKNPDVLFVSASQNVPGRYWENYNGFISENGTSVGLRQASVGDNYLATYGIKVLEGRDFSRDIPTDTTKVMINKAALEAYGWDSAIGKTLRSNGTDTNFTIIGVFDDFHYRSLQGNIQPLIHYYGGSENIQDASFISIKLMPDKAQGVLAYLQNEWKSLDSWLDFNYFFVDAAFDEQYRSVERTLFLIAFFAIVAIILSCSGIFALTAIAAHQRTKEIGIRKVLGASVTSIVGLLSKDFLKLVIIAMVLAAPLAWYGMNKWLQDFAYPINLDWWIFVLAGLSVLIIAFFTISLQSGKAALSNPVKSLRND